MGRGQRQDVELLLLPKKHRDPAGIGMERLGEWEWNWNGNWNWNGKTGGSDLLQGKQKRRARVALGRERRQKEAPPPALFLPVIN